MIYQIVHIRVFKDGTSVRCPLKNFDKESEAISEANSMNLHELKFHGDSEDVSFYRVRWIK